MTVTVVVDGGGSGCRLVAFGDDGSRLAAAENGPASLTLGEEQAWHHIQQGIRQIAGALEKPSNWLPHKLSLGLAGVLQLDRRERFVALLPAQIDHVLVTDGHAQLLGATGGLAGACLAVGTGSVLHWLDEQGRSGMAGGWGFPVGDEGSGAWLGMRLISAYLWFHDEQPGAQADTPLLQSLADEVGSAVSDIQLWSSSRNPAKFASLVPLIVAAENAGDRLAVSLLDEGAEQCYRFVSLAPKTVRVSIVGGMADVYHTRFSDLIGERLRAPAGDVFDGLYSLSRSPGSHT